MPSPRIRSADPGARQSLRERAELIARLPRLPPPPLDEVKLASWLIARQTEIQHAQAAWFRLPKDDLAGLLRSGRFRQTASFYSMI
jgi:hypothetical protein